MTAIADDTDLEKQIDRLYALPLDEFTGARDALAKQLRAGGDKDGAASVKSLRKPTAAAWAINQLSRKNGKALDDLLDLGERMRKAQRAALSGRGASTLRDLMQERRRAIDAMTKKAVAHLGASGAAQRDAIAATLEAALASEDDADAVLEGRLVKDLPPPSGFGDGPELALVPEPEPDDTDDDSPRARRRAARAAKRTERPEPKKSSGDDRRRELEAIVAEKEASLARAGEDAQAAAREAALARAEVSRLQDELVSANGRSKAATERARVAQWTQSQAQQDLDAAQRKLLALDD